MREKHTVLIAQSCKMHFKQLQRNLQVKQLPPLGSLGQPQSGSCWPRKGMEKQKAAHEALALWNMKPAVRQCCLHSPLGSLAAHSSSWVKLHSSHLFRFHCAHEAAQFTWQGFRRAEARRASPALFLGHQSWPHLSTLPQFSHL